MKFSIFLGTDMLGIPSISFDGGSTEMTFIFDRQNKIPFLSCELSREDIRNIKQLMIEWEKELGVDE